MKVLSYFFFYKGNPSWLTWFFLVFKGVGTLIIFLYTRKTPDKP